MSFQKEYYDKKHNFNSVLDLKRLDVVFKIIKPRGKLLDIACYDGTITKKFQDKGYEVEGIDYSDKAISLAKKKKKKIKVVKADITKKLPYKDETFDIVFCGQILEHLLKPVDLLKEVKRILKKNGQLIVTVPNISSLRNVFLILAGSLPAHASGYDTQHIRDFTKKKTFEMLNNLDFKKIKIFGDKISIPIGKKKSINFSPLITSYADYLIASCIK